MKYVVLLFALTFVIQGSAKTKTFYVADHLVDCVGVAPQKCMLIREKQTDEWSNFYGNIEGFNYEEGFEYLIKVKVKKIKNPPADGSSLKYTLLEVLRKRKTETQVSIYNNWKITYVKGLQELSDYPTMVIDQNENKITGFAGCNNYFGSFQPPINPSDSPKIDMSRMAMTRKMCPDMTVENTFTKCLNEVSYYKIEDGKLSFYNSSNEILLVCELDGMQ